MPNQRDAVMMQHMAELELNDRAKVTQHQEQRRRNWDDYQKRDSRQFTLTLLILLMMFVFVITIAVLVGMKIDNDRRKPEQQPAPWVGSLDFSEAELEEVRNEQPPEVPWGRGIDPLIAETLLKVRALDIDNDGRANCVDHVIQFWMYYPNKNVVRIIWNRNSGTGMNHLFVRVNGVDIEAGAFMPGLRHSNSEYGIRAFWPTKYAPSFNVDVTEHIVDIVAGRYWNRGN
jgi:hypothetical protein